MSEYKIETKCVQGAYEPGNGEPRVMPIYQSTTYKYESADHLGKLFDLKVPGHMYSRISNPSLDILEKKIAELEGGVGAMFTSSGQAANLMAVLNITSSGQNIVSLSSIYGGTINLFAVTMKRMGVEVRFITPDMSDEEAEKYIDENTRLVFGETIANPALNVLDIERYAKLAHKHGLPLVVDNTFATPVLCRPFEYGADIVDESYHGVVYTKDFGKAAYITKARVQLMRDFGAIPTAISAFMINTSLETLHLRMERHCENALKVARFLESHEGVSWVNYPLLESSPDYELARKYLKKGASGVISFGVKGGRQAAVKFMDSLKLAAIVVHVADARTSVLHPASTTHRQLTDEQLIAAGITPDLVRMSVGIENADDIINDIKQALEAV